MSLLCTCVRNRFYFLWQFPFPAWLSCLGNRHTILLPFVMRFWTATVVVVVVAEYHNYFTVRCTIITMAIGRNIWVPGRERGNRVFIVPASFSSLLLNSRLNLQNCNTITSSASLKITFWNNEVGLTVASVADEHWRFMLLDVAMTRMRQR